MKMCSAAVALMLASLSAAGCRAEVLSPQPVPVDKVECAHCGMLVSSESTGGEIVSAAAETRFYDDVVCLAADWPRYGAGAKAFVRTSGGAWAEAGSAAYVQLEGRSTPMGSGLTAFSTPAAAAAAHRSDHVLTWNDVLELQRDTP